MVDDYNYYVKYGRQKFKRLSKDGVDFYLGGQFDIEHDPKITQIVQIPKRFTADQARLILQNDRTDLYQTLYEKKQGKSQSLFSRKQTLRELEQQYDPSIHFIQVYDDNGTEYNVHGTTLRKRIGCGSESIETYNIDKLRNPIVKVFGRGDSDGKCIQKGRKYIEKKI